MKKTTFKYYCIHILELKLHIFLWMLSSKIFSTLIFFGNESNWPNFNGIIFHIETVVLNVKYKLLISVNLHVMCGINISFKRNWSFKKGCFAIRCVHYYKIRFLFVTATSIGIVEALWCSKCKVTSLKSPWQL